VRVGGVRDGDGEGHWSGGRQRGGRLVGMVSRFDFYV
jgi:hypothetical protein